jgi:tetratricopeptide (TPR) repeat protein
LINEKELNKLLEYFETTEKSFKSSNNNTPALLSSLEKNPNDLYTNYALGIDHAKKGKLDKALSLLLKAEEGGEKYVFLNHARIIIGYIYAVKEEYLSSKNYLVKVLDFSKNNPLVISILAYVYYKAGLDIEAIKLYKKCIDEEPLNHKLLNNIGFILIETKKDIDKGIELVNKALDIAPNTPSYLDSLGWGYYMKGNAEEALKTLQKAFSLAPSSKEIKDHINEVLNIS